MIVNSSIKNIKIIMNYVCLYLIACRLDYFDSMDVVVVVTLTAAEIVVDNELLKEKIIIKKEKQLDSK